MAKSFLSIFYIYSTFLGGIKALCRRRTAIPGLKPCKFDESVNALQRSGLLVAACRALAPRQWCRNTARRSVTLAGIGGEELLELVGDAVEFLAVGRRLTFDGNI